MIWGLVAVIVVALWLALSRERWHMKRSQLERASASLAAEVDRRQQLLPTLSGIERASGSPKTPTVEHDLAISEERITAAWRWYVAAFDSYRGAVGGIWVRLFARSARAGSLTQLRPEPTQGPILLSLGLTQCPTCGAPVSNDDVCPYCETAWRRAL